MIKAPSPENPLLVALLVDVSGSMTSSIKNTSGSSQNRLQSFQDALENLAKKAQENALVQDSESLVQLFAYGFGFGNILGSIFSGASSPPVRDLLEGATKHSLDSTIGINELAEQWSVYQSHVEGLAIKMFGATPMLMGVKEVEKRIKIEKQRINACGTVLFVLSDGEPTDSSSDDVVNAVKQFHSDDTMVVSCYVTDNDITSTRTLYGNAQSDWPTGAKLMFDIASEIPFETSFHHYLKEHQWKVENNAKLFTQVNQSEVLSEFLQVIISPINEVSSQDASTVFVSYSHKDGRWRDRLKVHLKPLVHEGVIDLWDDTRIQTGQDWRREIELALHKASVAIMLVSADFLASDFIVSEELPILLKAAERKGVKILPVIVSPARFLESAIGQFQAVNALNQPLSKLKKQEAEEVFVKLSKDVEQAIIS